jgi:GTPase SAR1 family protein
MESFEALRLYLTEAWKFIGPVPTIIAGNKIDLEDEREVTQTQVERVVTELSAITQERYGFLLKYYETSAKNGVNINTLFYDLARVILANFKTEIEEK